MCTTCLLIVFVEAFINVLAWSLMVAIFVRVIISWVPNLKLPFGLGDFVWNVSEPILGPIRRAIPFLGGIDLSPFIAFLLIQITTSLLLRLLPQPV